jgi:site-specific DNA-methyltransferase (adenine-specific)
LTDDEFRSTIRIVNEITKKTPGSRTSSGAADLLRPVFHDPKHDIRIYQGDCLNVMAAMPDESVDLIFADPPYFLSNDGITCQAGKMVSVNKGDWDKSRGADANHEFNRAWLAACQRLLKPNGSIWVSGTSHVIHSVGFAMQQLEFKLLNDVSWVKPNPPPNLSCRYFTHATETIIWAAKNKKSRHTFNYKLMREENGGKQMKSVWHFLPPQRDEKRFGKHPAQKPLALIERIIAASSNEGDLVLDPFMGSGTTAVAAMRCSRTVLAIERDDEFISTTLSRIAAELILVSVTAVSMAIDLDLVGRSMDRSMCNENGAMDALNAGKLVRSERSFYFVGTFRREVVYSVVARDMEEAIAKFSASTQSTVEILLVVKTETEIYLAEPR